MTSERARVLYSASYGVAFVMLATAVADVVGRILPLRLGIPAWRIGSLGVVTLQVPTLLLALLLASLAAWHLQHRLVLGLLSGISLAVSLVFVVVLPYFFLDLLELRGSLDVEALAGFDMGMGRAALTIILAAVVSGWMGYAAWLGARRQREGFRSKEREKDRDKGRGAMLVGQDR